MDERDIENANADVDAERDHQTQKAKDIVAGHGSDDCIDCDQAISVARRKAAPFAERCIACQTRKERKAKLHGS